MEGIPDPAVPDLEAVWDAEWEKHLLATATERVKRQVKPEHFQMFDLLLLRHWPVRDVARVMGMSAARIYLIKHRVGRLLQRELQRLQSEH